jgi:uncharacterized protein (DUF488 family)
MSEAHTASDCTASGVIHTIGHSTRTTEQLIDLLSFHRIELLIDVRRWPMSKRNPQFNRQNLRESLKESGIDYLWRQDLGGFRKAAPDSPNSAWRVPAFRAYADFMLTAEFEKAAAEIETLARSRRIALMCAEAVHWQCHRQLLADALVVRGWTVLHIRDDACHEHDLTPFARTEGTRITYPGLL